MSAVRLARGFTGRSKIVKFAGCYHGHADCVLDRRRLGRADARRPDSPGVTEGTAARHDRAAVQRRSRASSERSKRTRDSDRRA